MPNLWFDSVKGNGFDTFGVDNAAAIFDGCDRLNEDPARLNEAIKDLEEWYATPADRELKRSQVDTDRYGVPMYVLENKQDVRLYLDNQRKYRGGLVLRPADGDVSSWFDSASIEGIDVIDLTEVKNAQALFNDADINRLGRIVGAENIVNASYMFSFMSGLRTIPAINLASAEKVDGIFSYCPNIRVIKTGNEYRTKFNLDKVQSDEVDIAKLVFGDAAQIMIQRFGESLGEWLDPMKERVV